MPERRYYPEGFARPARVDLGFADFCVWRGRELEAFTEFVDAFVPNAVLLVQEVRVHG